MAASPPPLDSPTIARLAVADGIENRSMLQLMLRAFRRHRPAMVGSIVLLSLVLSAVFAPNVTPYEPKALDLLNKMQAPTLSHPMGTDELGRDMLARILYGGRISLSIGIMAMFLAVMFGVSIGGLAGYFGGRVDTILMRFTDMMLTFPSLFVLIVLSLALRDLPIPALRGTAFASVVSIVLVISALSWMSVARLIRASFITLKEQEFIESARSMGSGNMHIMVRHLLPNSLSPIIVAATFRVATSITTESGLSYLGFGVQPPTATWGVMLRTAQSQMSIAPWTAIFPGLMIFVSVMAINFIGDGLRDALDPYKSTQ